MAIKAVSLSGSVAASSRGNFLSPPILTRHRPVAILLWVNSAGLGSKYSVFLTKSETPVEMPQVGDPPVFQLLDIQAPAANLVVIPLSVQTIVEPPVRFNLSYFNYTSSSVTVTATYVYEEVV